MATGGHGKNTDLESLKYPDNITCALDEELEPRFRRTSLVSPERQLTDFTNRLSHNSRFKWPIRNLVYTTFDRKRVGVGKDAIGLNYGELKVIEIYRLKNEALLQTYSKYKKYIAGQIQEHLRSFKSGKQLLERRTIKTVEQADNTLAKRCDESINEFYLFYGTSYDNARSILRTGFSTTSCSHDSPFGQAIYLAESSSKADQYADDRHNRVPNGESLYMIVTKACLGIPYVCQSAEKFRRPPCINLSCCSETCDVHPHFHSVIGAHTYDESDLLSQMFFREFVIYDGSACYPEFVVEYKRLGSSPDPQLYMEKWQENKSERLRRLEPGETDLGENISSLSLSDSHSPIESRDVDINVSVTKSTEAYCVVDLDEKMTCIGDKEHNEIIEKINNIRKPSDFSLRIPNIGVEPNRVLVRYVTKTNANAEQAGQTAIETAQDAANLRPTTEEFTEDDVARDVNTIRDALSRIVPFAEIIMTEIQSMPRFRATAGLGSGLTHENGLVNIRNRFGCVTALLHGTTVGHPEPKDYILTVAHLPDFNVTRNDNRPRCIEEGDPVRIIGDDNVVGTVHKVIHDNGDNKEFVDAALIELEDGAIQKLRLRQSFNINGELHRLSPSEVELPQVARVVLKAVDQRDGDDTHKGYITQAYLDIFDDPGCPDMPKYKLMQMLQCSAEGNVRAGAIHRKGESGMLTTYEPVPTDRPTHRFVQPVVMLTGLYPHFDEHGLVFYETSLGVALSRVIRRMSATLERPLEFFFEAL